MRSSVLSFGFLKSYESVRFSTFESNFNEDKKSWEEIYDSIISSDYNKYFMGSIISYEDNGLVILDGKKRIITVSIIFRILDFLISKDDQIKYIGEAIWNYYKFDYNSGNGLRIRLDYSPEDKLLDLIFRGNDIDYLRREYSNEDMVKCFLYFYDLMKDNDLFTLLQIFDNLTKKDNIILISFDDDEDLFKLKYVNDYFSFDSVAHLLFENYFSYLISEDCNIIKSDIIIKNLYNEYWLPTFKNDKFWKNPSQNKNLTHEQFVFYEYFKDDLKLYIKNIMKNVDFSKFKFSDFKNILVGFTEFADKYYKKYCSNVLESGFNHSSVNKKESKLERIIRMIDEGIDDNGNEAKIGMIICKLCYEDILWDYLTDDDINNLLDEKFCNKVFKLGPHYPFLSTKKLYKGNKFRYYAESINLRGQVYYITSEWYRGQLPSLRKYLCELNERKMK